MQTHQSVLQRPYPTQRTRSGRAMGSSRRHRRSGYYFGFSGKRSSRRTQPTTTDEILDSLTRQAKLMEESGNARTLGLETILEDDSSEDIPRLSSIEPKMVIKRLNRRNLSKLPFAIMCVGGLTFLWIYSRLSQSVSLARLSMIQQTISSAGFADWPKIALMAVCALTTAILVRRSREKIRSRTILTV